MCAHEFRAHNIQGNEMKNLTSWILALALASAGGAAQAAVEYEASLNFVNGLPKLRTGSPAWDGPGTLDGAWTDLGDPHARAYGRDQLGYELDPGTGEARPVWDAWHGTEDLHRAAGPLNSLHEAHGRANQLDHRSSAGAHVEWYSMASTGTIHAPGAAVDASTSWSRGFTLAANASMTFSALADLGISGDAAPLDRQTWTELDAGRSFASLVMADAADRVGARLSATLDGMFGDGLGSMFSYAISREGLLSLTLTNNTASVLTGTLSAGTFVNASVMAPVPEPEAVLSLLAGLAVVGVRVRRRPEVPAPV